AAFRYWNIDRAAADLRGHGHLHTGLWCLGHRNPGVGGCRDLFADLTARAGAGNTRRRTPPTNNPQLEENDRQLGEVGDNDSIHLWIANHFITLVDLREFNFTRNNVIKVQPTSLVLFNKHGYVAFGHARAHEYALDGFARKGVLHWDRIQRIGARSHANLIQRPAVI